jgi:hypothetical protein
MGEWVIGPPLLPLPPAPPAVLCALLVAGLKELVTMQEWTLAEQVQPDAWWVARAVQGEMGAYDWGPLRDTVALKLVWSIESRRQKEWYPSSRRGVITNRDGYHGYVRVIEPEPWALDIAQQGIDQEMNDQGPLFVLGDNDLADLGITDRGLEYRTVDGQHGLHFYWVWPE